MAVYPWRGFTTDMTLELSPLAPTAIGHPALPIEIVPQTALSLVTDQRSVLALLLLQQRGQVLRGFLELGHLLARRGRRQAQLRDAQVGFDGVDRIEVLDAREPVTGLGEILETGATWGNQSTLSATGVRRATMGYSSS